MKYLTMDFPAELFNENNLGELLHFLPINVMGIPKPISEVVKFPIDVKVFSRLNLSERDSKEGEIKQQISSQRKNYEIISVEPQNASLAAFAARDRRVDIIRISSESMLKVFNTRFGRRLDEYKKLVEVDISFFWNKQMSTNMRPVMRILKTWKNCSFPLLLLHQINSLSQLRSYPGLQAMGRILGIPNTRSSANHILQKIEYNRRKLEGNVPVQGIEVSDW